ncbi:MAG: aminoglycoside phosphotransferase family protein [Gammaproteobacteria bacterium]|nr:aminoglycoside phosphotransferase family protein [Gammaproteobacteria bacterium]
MHDNEIILTEKDVYLLLKNQFPDLASLKLSYIPESGTENALFRLGNEYVVRLPRFLLSKDAFEKNEKTLTKEFSYLPYLASYLSFPIAKPLFKGDPTAAYPFFWSISRYNEGHNPPFEQANEYNDLAKDLAQFLNQFHEIPVKQAPSSRRGIKLIYQDEETQNALAQLKDDIDVSIAKTLWDTLKNIPYWPKDPVWIHGDLLPGNILIQNNRLAGIIDFSDLGLGDPACDLIPAWCLFNTQSRQIFRKNLNDVDDNTWLRGKGWALSIALILLPYYKSRSPIMTVLAQQMLKNIFLDEEQ